MQTGQVALRPPPPFTRTRWHVSKIGVGAVGVGIVAATDGAVLAALIAGAFTLVNTGLTVWLTGRQRDHRRQDDEDDE